MGAAAGDKLTGHLAQDYGWQVAVRFWAACAFGGAVVLAGLWNVRQRGESTAELA
jgi:sugar phosphate permease